MKTFLAVGDCPVRNILSRLGDKWSLLVLISLSVNGILRFSDIQKSIGDISQRMLAVTLRSLEADGLVNRRAYAEVPPKVEYCLTKAGKELLPHIQNLVGWAVANRQDIMESRQKHQ
ncbi:MAG: helix-turn-helix transcriptional regulator [Candidatus Symbiothrix sp.]|jgi:DNA-binding HxlR family transcriptional regulator|nr:helix-turn-helix transcriptional regulator [Candidatus Symbiothrix sp.]